MKKIALFSCLFSVLFALPTFAQQMLKIKVKDVENLNLPGASILLKPGNHAGVTNQNGEFALAKISKGEYMLTITYIGYATVEKKIEINKAANEIVEIMTPGYTSNKAVMVIGDRLKGQAKALSQQKNNSNISNIVSADQMGRFPDANIGDAIKRIPGVTMQNDQGEARNIVIRGMGPELNAVSLNGERIPSAEGDNRRVQMDLIPSDMIQTVEVSKTLTPEMDADAIGGAVNLITRTPSNGLRLSTTLAGGYNPIRQSFNGTGNMVIGSRFAKNKIGFVISGSYNNNKYGSDNVEAVWKKTDAGKLYIDDHDVRIYDEWRIRKAVAATIDYKINTKNTITLSSSYNWRDDLENRFRLRHRTRSGFQLLYDANGEITGYKGGEVLRQTKGGIDNNRSKMRRLEDQRTTATSLKGEHIFGGLKLDWSVQYAKASEKRPNERYIAMGRRKIDVVQNISDKEFPILTDAVPFDQYTRFDEFSEQYQDQYEKDINSKINIEIPVSVISGQSGFIKFGSRSRIKFKVRNNKFFSYEPTGDNEDNYKNISLLPLIDKTNDDFFPGSKFIGGRFVSPSFLGTVKLKDATLFEETDEPAEYLAQNFEASEGILAGYVQWKQNFTEKFSMTAGLRIERTLIEYTGNIVEEEDQLVGKTTITNSYTDFLPGVNLRFEPTKNFILRAAVTRGIARPKYYDLVPYFNINPNDKELSAGNPKLEPIRSWNIDLMAEKYFKSIGLISGGVFYKKLDQFYFTFRDDKYTAEKFANQFPSVASPIKAGDEWQFTQSQNGSGVNVVGFEAAFQRQLNFLPGVWKGLGIYTNYTYTHSSTNGFYNADGKLVRSDVALPGTAPHMFNASLSFENKKLVVRLSANYTAAYIDDSDDGGYNEDAFNDRYYDNQFFLDANASYMFAKNWRIFVEANNLTNQPLRYYQGEKERTAQVEYYGPRYNAGIKFDFYRK